ncbi:cupin domain-containing protein [Frigidibacter sp. ROC022]|uniref:cupin domain-containing protein n=1 Tax=Frigidibacter sp. ROC022 TaxID=2971796 RepID=UPI00215A5B2B|nr:cupin domain-containing protein [Frigidibacter sp. ROC022]MCR8723140.1 cupin domain-containing protein [Frigidibacter sp. ROC022]
MTVLRRGTVPETDAVSTYPEPYNRGRGRMFYAPLSDVGGLTQFGAAFERLVPGGKGSQKHWHEREDEFLYLISGRLTVTEGETETVMEPGDAACWKAGEPVGHTIRNDGDVDAVYLIVGSRDPQDICHYPGLDMRLQPLEGGGHGFVHLDGTPWPEFRPK